MSGTIVDDNDAEAQVERRVYRAKHAYVPDDPDGLYLLVGDSITDVVDAGNGWVVCHNKTTGKTGLCPKSYLERDKGRNRSFSLGRLTNRISNVYLTVTTEFGASAKSGPYSERLGREKANVPVLTKCQRLSRVLVGLIGGILLGGLMFLALHYLYHFTLKEAGIISGAITLIMGLGLIFSSNVRCVTLLMGVTVFTNQGRVALLSLVPALILSGPIMNMHNNINQGVNSVACVGEVLYNYSYNIQQNVLTTVRRQQAILEEGEERINQSISNLTTNLLPKAPRDSVQECSNRLKRMRSECEQKVNKTRQTCEESPSEGTSGLNLGLPCKTTCKVLTPNTLCSHLNEEVCTRSSRPARSPQNDPQFSLRERLKEQLGFRVNATRVLDVSSNNSFNPTEKILRVKDEIQRHMDKVVRVFSLINKILIIFIILAFINACVYLGRYRKNIKYDNIYITSLFKSLNSELRKIDPQKAVLPLDKKEERKYIDSTSAKLRRAEAFAWKIGISQILFHAVIASFFILLDYALFYLLELVRKNGGSDVVVSGAAILDVDIEGMGPVADLVRSIYSGNTASNNFHNVLNFEQCLPNASEPSEKTSYTVISLYAMTLIFVLLQSYGLRLRRKIMAFFFPERETKRIHYLYRHILLKRKVKSEESEQINLLSDKWSGFLEASTDKTTKL